LLTQKMNERKKIKKSNGHGEEGRKNGFSRNDRGRNLQVRLEQKEYRRSGWNLMKKGEGHKTFAFPEVGKPLCLWGDQTKKEGKKAGVFRNEFIHGGITKSARYVGRPWRGKPKQEKANRMKKTREEGGEGRDPGQGKSED